MKRFSKISIDDIKSIQVDSGVLLKEFDVENPVFLPENVICATSGGINPVCAPEYYDFGEDVDNAKSAKETKRIRGWNVSISFTTFTTSLTLIRLALGAADVSGKVLSLRQRLQYAKDFKDIWWVGKRADDKLLAIRLIRSLSDSGFSLQTTKRGKGKISITLKGHSSFVDKNKIPMEVYVIGEFNDPVVPDVPETPVNPFTTLDAKLPIEGTWTTAAAVGTNIYLFGGYAGVVEPFSNIAKFDTETGATTLLDATLPTASYNRAAVAVGTKIYLFGGQKAHGGSPLLSVVKFDTETETITVLDARLPTAAGRIGAAAVGTKIYLFGGGANLGNSSPRPDWAVDLSTILKFDTETETITTLDATLPTKVYGIGAAAVGTKIYLFGGSYRYKAEDDDLYVSHQILSTILKFDTETETITTLDAKLPPWETGTRLTVLVGTGIYWIARDDDYFTRIAQFDTATETITALAAKYPTKYFNERSAAAVGAKIYIFGGEGVSVAENSIVEFDTELVHE